MEQIGVTLSEFLSYAPTGGTCRRPDCDGDAPQVKLGERVVPLLCKAHYEEEEAVREQEERVRLAALFLTGSGRTPRLSRFSFDTFRQACRDENGRQALAVTEGWTNDYLAGRGTPNLMLHGRVGTGKTGLAWSAVRSICEHGVEARIVNFAHLLEQMKDCYQRGVSTTMAAEANRLPVLALDDLGVEKPTEWACTQLYGLVDHRHERGLPTIYVSNYNPDALGQRLGRDDPVIGERIVSRMLEGGAVRYEFTGRDRRIAAAA